MAEDTPRIASIGPTCLHISGGSNYLESIPLGAEASSMYGVESESQAKSEILIKSKLGNEYRDSTPGKEG
jgi:hypothetical protein